MPRPRPIRRIRQKVGTALQNWSRRRVGKVVPALERRVADQEQKIANAGRQIDGVYREQEWSRFRETNLSAIRSQQEDIAVAAKEVGRLSKKAERIKARHTKGWIGKTIRKVKGP